MNNPDLGFLTDCESWLLESRMFPSKFGGKPAWLSLKDLPSPEDLQCEKCKQPMIFLCQIYAPLDNDVVNFHRTLFVFICRNGKCCQRNDSNIVKVFRSNLGKVNEFYPSTPPVEEKDESFRLDKWVKLCRLCGCLAPKSCSKCKTVYYCSKEHQTVDWKETHKKECGIINTDKLSTSLFPEKMVEIDAEEYHEKKTENEAAEIKKYKKLVAEGKAGTLSDVSDKELDSLSALKEDEVFGKFKKRVELYPDQVIRHERGGKPLWIAKEPIPKKIPDCEYCGSKREFEFQIMPQSLSLLNEYEIDFGIIVIYTCKKSCTGKDSYKKEFAFKQDVAPDEA